MIKKDVSKFHGPVFQMRLCSDVFLNILQLGKRIELTKLELYGKRFYRLIDGWITQAPYHLLTATFYLR